MGAEAKPDRGMHRSVDAGNAGFVDVAWSTARPSVSHEPATIALDFLDNNQVHHVAAGPAQMDVSGEHICGQR